MSRSSASRRARLTRILDLPANASEPAVAAAIDRLVAALRARQAKPDLRESERAALREEIERLEAVRPRPATRRPDRLPLLGALLGTFVALAALFFHAAGNDAEDRETGPSPLALSHRPRLELEGPLPEATLRVLDADRTTLVAEMRAEGAVVELDRGRYALEVRRPGCPEAWTRSVYLAPGTVHRFAPTLCTGEGRLVVRSNVPESRLRIDGELVGAPGEVAHVLGVGEHEITVERDGFRRWVEQVRIVADSKVERMALLLPEREATPRARRLDLGFDADALAPPPPPAPTPFDMGDLADSIAPEKTGRATTRLLERAGLGGLPDGGSTAWHDRVRKEFLARFDSDTSGRIDRFEESEAITCTWWRETEQSFDEGGLGLSMARYYGFDGSEWHPGALGFERSIRSVAYERMRACGLQARAGAPFSGQI